MTDIVWTNLNSADFGIIGIIVISSLISLIRGFIREALSLATWVVAAWVAIRFSPALSDTFIPYFSSASMRTVIAFGVLFVLTLIVGGLINFLFSQLVDRTGLSGTDRILGLVFGVIRGILVVGVLVMLGNIMEFGKETWWSSSQLIPHFQELAAWFQGFLPDQLENHISKATTKTS